MQPINPEELKHILKEIESHLHNFALLVDDLNTISDTIKAVNISLQGSTDKEDLHCVYNELIAWAILGKVILNRGEVG